MSSRVGSILAAVFVIGTAFSTAASPIAAAQSIGRHAAIRTGVVQLRGEIPTAVTRGKATFIRAHAVSRPMTLNFNLPLRNYAGLERLIAREGKTHEYLTHKQVYARFSPTRREFRNLRSWLKSQHFTITHQDRERTSIQIQAPTARIERVLSVRINDYRAPKGYDFFSNTRPATVPAYLNVQGITGLENFERFHDDLQMYHRTLKAIAQLHKMSHNHGKMRTGGYYGSDLRGLYDIGHGYDGTGQTVGFTLWYAPVTQGTMTAYAAATGDTPITVDPSCVTGTGSETNLSTCQNTAVQSNHLMFVCDDSTACSTNYTATDETNMDVESAHAIAPNVAEKYYVASSSSNANLQIVIADAGADPTLHTISNSWGGGDITALNNSFYVATNNSMALAAAAGTTFYFSSGDSGDTTSYPPSSGNDVAVGGTAIFSQSDTTKFATETGWGYNGGTPGGGGSFCTTVIPRPAWQTGAGVSANAVCPNRAVADVAADGDPGTGVDVYYTQSADLTILGGSWLSGTATLTYASTTAPTVGSTVYVTGVTPGGYDGTFTVLTASATQITYALATDPGGPVTGGGNASFYEVAQVGGTSLSAPIWNGFTADLENFVAAQTYSGSPPAIGFTAPVIYSMGNSANYDDYFRDITCGENPATMNSPDGDAASSGWDEETGFGSVDWYHFAIGYAQQLGATNLATPSSLQNTYPWSCVPVSTNGNIKGIACPTSTTCLGIGPLVANGGLITGGSTNVERSVDGGQTWYDSTADMSSVACTSTTACVAVGDGGRVSYTTNGGVTWTAGKDQFNETLESVACATSSICVAGGIRGAIVRTTDGGHTWTTEDTSPATGSTVYAVVCPSSTVCYASDSTGDIDSSTDAGATFTVSVGGAGGASGVTTALRGMWCADTNTCVVVGSSGVIRLTTNGWTTTSTAVTGGTGTMEQVSCLPGVTITCYAVNSTSAAGGTVRMTANLTAGTAWTAPTVTGPTTVLASVSCPSSGSTCYAAGSLGTVSTLTGSTATAATVITGINDYLLGINCPSTSQCTAIGQQGLTLQTTNSGTSWSQQAGGTMGSTNTTAASQYLNAIACANSTLCFAVGNNGVMMRSTDAGQSWFPQSTGTSQTLYGISCANASTCTAVGGGATVTGGSWASTSGGTATVTFAAQPSAPAIGSTIVISEVHPGAAVIDYDGTYTVTASTTTSASFAMPTTLAAVDSNPNGTLAYTGNILFGGVNGTVITTSNANNAGGSTWTAEASNSGNPLKAVSCQNTSPSATCVAVGMGGAVVISTDGGNTWTAETTSTGNILNGVDCPSGATSTTLGCLAVGTGGTILATSNSGSSWSSQTSGTTQDLYAVTCLQSYTNNCFATGMVATTLASVDGGTTWAQQGNPISGPVSGLNSGARTSNGVYEPAWSVACTTATCFAGVGRFGSLMSTPLLTVTVNASQTYGTSPNLTGLSPTDGSISYNPSSEGANVSGALTCSTTATDSSNVGSYPISGCTGLSDSSYSIVYDYVDSSDTVTQAAPTLSWPDSIPSIVYGTPLPSTNLDATSNVAGTFAYSPAAGSILPGGTDTITATFTSSDPNYRSGDTVTNTIDVTPRGSTVTMVRTGCTGTSCHTSTYGNQLTYSAHVVRTGGSGANPDGQVELVNTAVTPNQVLDTETLASDGTATLTPNPVDVHVGVYEMEVVYVGSANYSGSSTSPAVKLTVKPAPVTVTASNASTIYGDAKPTITPSYSGLVPGDPNGASAVCTTTVGPTTVAGTYASTCSNTASDADYSYKFVKGVVTVSQAHVTLAQTSGTTVGNGSTVSASVIRTEGSVPLSGLKVIFTLTDGHSSATCNALSSGGSVSCAISTTHLVAGAGTLSISYAGHNGEYSAASYGPTAVTITH